MSSNKSDIIVGLDIGTTKISVIVGRQNDHNKIEVLGMGRAESLGVHRGMVSNIEKTVAAIKLAVEKAEATSGCEITDVYVGIAGKHIKSLQHRGSLTRENIEEEIRREDIEAMIEDMHKLVLDPGDKIIHVLPQDFIVDNEKGIKDPVGMVGRRLEANFHIITGCETDIKNIYRCVQKAGLRVRDLILEPLASSAAVLTGEEIEAGVTLVDIGGGTTDIAIFHDDIIRHTDGIPFGGNIVTEDVKAGCSIMKNQAELLKIKFGSALSSEAMENEIVSIPGLRGRAPKEISVINLAKIIQARMQEILENVDYVIKCSGYHDKLIGGIVITGGGSQLNHLKQLVEYSTGLEARIGYPNEHLSSGMVEEARNPMYATGIGLIIKGLEDKTQPKEVQNEKVRRSMISKWFRSLISKGEEFLNEEDSEFN